MTVNASPKERCANRSGSVGIDAAPLPASHDFRVSLWDVVGNVHYQNGGRTISLVCFGKVKSEARPDQLITFARCLGEAPPIKYRDLPSASFNQTGTFQLPYSIRDGWPLDTQHFAEQVLSDREHVTVTAVTHHEQPTRQPLLEAVRTVARDRHHDLFEKGLDVSVHEALKDGIDCMARVNAARDIFAALPGIWTRSWTEERLAPKMACTSLQPSLPIVAISMMLPSP